MLQKDLKIKMEIIVNSPGLLHIAKKIIGYFDYQNWHNNLRGIPLTLETIKSLRLVCKSWKAIIESKEMCQYWQRISRKNESLKDVEKVLDVFYKKAYENNDVKLKWQLSYYVLNNIAKSKYPTEEICHLQKNFHKKFLHWKFEAPEVFLSTSPFGLVEDIFNEDIDVVDFREIDILKLLIYSTLYCGRDDIVKLIYNLFPTQLQGEVFSKNFVAPLCFYTSQTKSNTYILDMTISETCPNLRFPNIEQKFMKIISMLADHLRNLKYPQDVAYSVLQGLHFLAILDDNFELVSIVAEKLGQEYADLAINFMSKNTDRISYDILSLMVSKIDQNDIEKINASKDSSLLKAAKEGNFKFIMNFTLYSSTIHKKDQNGKNALHYGLEFINSNQKDLRDKEQAVISLNILMKFTVLHYNENIVDHLKNLKYPQDVAFSVLQGLHLLAVLDDNVKIASIVAEKLGQDYVDFAINSMSKQTDSLSDDILSLMASKIDQNDNKKIKADEDSSLLKAAKIKDYQFILRFGPFSSTIDEKDQNGKNALFYVLKSRNMSSEEWKLQEMAVEILMRRNTMDENLEKPDTKLEEDSDFCFEDSENESVDLYESESDCDL